MRYLGVDLGGVRTGLALSDPIGVTCRPLEVVEERDEDRLVARIVAVVESEGVEGVVVGMPRPLSGGTNAQLERARAFADRLATRTHVAIIPWDERFTTKLAERGRRGGPPADAVAACHLLQNYLDSLSCRSADPAREIPRG